MALITRINESVNDRKILPLGGIRIYSKAVESPNGSKRVAGIAGDFTAVIIGDGYFTDQTLTENQGKTKTFTGSSTHYFWTSNGNFEIQVVSKYDLLNVTMTGEGMFADIDTLGYMSNVTTLSLQSPYIEGNIETVNTNPLMTSFTVGSGNFLRNGLVGDLGKLAGTSLATLNVNQTLCNGKISEIFGNASLANFSAYMVEGIEGDISALADRTNIETLRIGGLRNGVNAKITGSITDLGKNIDATILQVPYTAVTGTCDDLAAALAANGKTSGTVQIQSGDGTTKSFTFPLA